MSAPLPAETGCKVCERIIPVRANVLKFKAVLLCKEVPCFENLHCVNYRNVPSYCCQQSTFLRLFSQLGVFCLWCGQGAAFCDYSFA